MNHHKAETEFDVGGTIGMAKMDRAAIEQLLQEIEELLSMREGFAATYRKWRPEAIERVRAACGDACAEEFENKGPTEIPVNRQHRVHVYRQTLTAQSRYLTQLLEAAEAEEEE